MRSWLWGLQKGGWPDHFKHVEHARRLLATSNTLPIFELLTGVLTGGRAGDAIEVLIQSRNYGHTFEKKELGDHTRSHTLEKPSQCQICRRGFRKKSTSGQHEKLKLCGEFSCPKPGYGCPEGYPERNELVLGDIYDKSSSHDEATNAPQDNRPCYVCKKSDHPGNTISCGHCNDPYYTACAGLKQIPLQKWVCKDSDTLAQTRVAELMREPCQAWEPADKQNFAVLSHERGLQFGPRLLEFCRSLTGPEQDQDQQPPPDDPPTVSIAQSFPPTFSTDENLNVGNEVVSARNPMTLGFERDGMLSQGLSGAARDSSLDWCTSADSLQDVGGNIIDREQDQGRNQPPDDAYLCTVSVTPPFNMWKTPASCNEAIPVWNSMAPGGRYDWTEPMLDGCIPGTMDHLCYESTDGPLQATAMQPSPEPWINGIRLDDMGSGTEQERYRTDDEALICLTQADVHGLKYKWNDSGAMPAPPPSSTAFDHESSTYSNVNPVDTSGCSSDPLSRATSPSLERTDCVAQKSASWTQSTRDSAQLYTTCDATRPQELLVKMTRKRQNGPSKCTNCLTASGKAWNLSKEFRLCVACGKYERSHGGAARPKKLYERGTLTRKRRSGLRKCTNCLTEEINHWRWFKGVLLCNACCKRSQTWTTAMSQPKSHFPPWGQGLSESFIEF
ncbi:hypothetical protein ACEPPN_001045 [Leptodophora sp. 'Broadleaf-Isolate-01']